MSDTDTTEAPALPGDGLRESIVDELRRHIGDGLIEHLLKPQDDLWIRVATDKWADTGRALQSMGFEYFCFLSALDWKPSPFGRGEDDPTQPPPERKTEIVQGVTGGETRFQVFARVTDIKRHVGVTIKADVDDANPAIGSWHAIYAGANWHERETHEMFGIGFTGHPDLRNMYLPTEFEGYPLRKDFPLLARLVKPWPGIVDVEPMPAEDADGDGVADAAPAAAEGDAADAPAADAPAADAPAADAPAADASPADAPAEDAPAADAPAADAPAADAEGSDAAAPAEAAAVEEAPEAGAAASDADAAASAVAPTEPSDGTDALESAKGSPGDQNADQSEAADSAAAAEPEGEIETVAGTAEEVEAVADAEAEESLEADETAADAAADAAAEASMTEPADVEAGADSASSAEPAVAEEAPEVEGAEASDGSETSVSPKITDASTFGDTSDEVAEETAEPVAAAGLASLHEPATEESELPDASPAPESASEATEAGPYAGSLVAVDDGSMPAGFEIKGNAQSMLIHVPGSRYYNVTKPEYWFDTEENARAAGFKKPGEKDHD